LPQKSVQTGGTRRKENVRVRKGEKKVAGSSPTGVNTRPFGARLRRRKGSRGATSEEKKKLLCARKADPIG